MDSSVSVVDIYESMRNNVAKVLAPTPLPVLVAQAASNASSAALAAAQSSSAVAVKLESLGPKRKIFRIFTLTSNDRRCAAVGEDLNGYYELDEEVEEGVGEKLQSEIEKFRLRQKQRDV